MFQEIFKFLYILIGSIVIVLYTTHLQKLEKKESYVFLPVVMITLILLSLCSIFSNMPVTMFLPFLFFLLISMIGEFINNRVRIALLSIIYLVIIYYLLITGLNDLPNTLEFSLLSLFLAFIFLFSKKIYNYNFQTVGYLILLILFLFTNVFINNFVYTYSMILWFFGELFSMSEYELKEGSVQFTPKYFAISLSSFAILILPFGLI